MNPIYKEYCQFLKDKTGLELEEGYYWYDNSIIKAFDKQGKLHKIYRIKVNDNLSMTISKPKSYINESEVELMSWYELVELNKESIVKRENISLELIREKLDKFKGYTPLIPISTGKDSMVTMHLIRQVVPEAKAIFNNTSLDVADTYRMVKTIDNCETMNPDKGFYQYVKSDHIIPTRFSRFCCRIFKTGVMVQKLDHETPYLMFMGMRNQESTTRSNYQDEIYNPEWGITKWQGILPIREWSELDVWLYIMYRDIEVNRKYRKGYSRVGCGVCCPYYTKSTWVLDEYWYPSMRERWMKILKEDFIENKKWIVMNCTLEEYLQKAWNGGTLRGTPTKDVIEEFAEYNNLDVGDTKVAAQYFNKYCSNGCKSKSGKLKRIKNRDEIAMNLKFHGRDIEKFLCKKCFMKLYEMNEEKWNWYIERFKQDGCSLFGATKD
ncbi:MAG: phosphoadenosine phosphosulfate reductase family protein [Clostridiales bacterium]|nr:phosphoadenosine phosphosulfate reductase family protein [Clostridiales bacterium]